MSRETNPQAGTAIGLSRRSFLKTTGLALGAAATAGGVASLPLSDLARADASSSADASTASDAQGKGGEQVFSCACRSNCMGACRLHAHVRDGKLVKLEPADFDQEGYTGCCLKGLSYIERIYSPMRIQYPMRRVGERGAGEWERISWDEAIAELAEHIQAAADEFGPQSIFFDAASGNYGYVNGVYSSFARVAACLGANKLAVGYDYAAGHGIDRVLGTGDWYYCNEPKDMLNASMVVVWGTNPVLTAPHQWRWIMWAKEKGAKLVTIDPIKSATAHRSDEYIPVRVGHDGYLALAMANYVIEHDLVDWDFIKEKSNAAFLVREDTGLHLRKSDYEELPVDKKTGKPGPDDFYVWDQATGDIALIGDAKDPAYEGSFTTKDGIHVSPSYGLLKEHLAQYSLTEAARTTGLTEEQIADLATRFAEETVTVNITYGLDHYVNGYLNTWAIAVLMALTGNFAKSGAGFAGVFTGGFSTNFLPLWVGAPDFKAMNSQIPQGLVPDIFATQKLEGKDYPAKVMVSYCSNLLGNLSGQADFMKKVLPNIDYWAVVDMEMNDSASYADLVLPCCSWYEVDDVRMAYNNPYLILQEKAIEPLYESKPDSEIALLLGRALGFEASFPDELLDFDTTLATLLDTDVARARGVTPERLREQKYLYAVGDDPDVPLVRGLTVPFPTETGRVSLYTEKPKPRLDWGQDLSERAPHEHLAYYRDAEEVSVDSPLAEKYPIAYLQEHARWRTHGQWGYVPMLRELDPEPIAKVSRADAEARGVQTGDMVEVFNDRGHCVVKALIDDSIAPGVLSIPKGWQRSQHLEGSYQEMTQPKIDPYPAAASFYDARVDFKKA